MSDQRQKFLGNAKDLHHISDLETTYLTAWNNNARSRGKGPAIGKAFENWITNQLKTNKKIVQKGKVPFIFGNFPVDAAIPSLKSPVTILEIKLNADIQDSLMFEGFINNLNNPNTKIGLVTLYDFGTFYLPKSSSVKKILSATKLKYPNFDFFHIENGWSSEITRLINFC